MCDYSEGWLQYFKPQHGLKFHAVCGEKHSAEKEGAAKFVGKFAKLVEYAKGSSKLITL